MKPYYQDEFATIYHGDCREILPGLEPVDLVLTDPPYGLQWEQMGFQQNFKTDWQAAKKWDTRQPSDLIQTVKQAGRQWIIWGGNYMASDLGDCKAPLVWDKQTGGNNFADGEMAFTSFKAGTLRIFRLQWCGAFKDTERGKRSVHPTQKPVSLMAWSIKQAGRVETVLDPFMGSGTTLRAAKDLGLKSIGIELEEKYCEIAAKRLQQEVLWSAMAAS